MNDVDALERAVLSRARSGLSPSAEQQARVLRRTRAALVPGALVAEREDVFSRLVSPGRALRALGLGLLIGAVGVGSYFAGVRAGREESARTSLPALSSATNLAEKKRLAVEPAPAQPAIVRTAEPPATPAPRAPSPPSGRAAHPLAPAESVEAGANETDLERELRMLRRIERALRDGNPRLALGLLGELDREVPNGKLDEERHAARVAASCEMDPASAAMRAAEFLRGHPHSVYLDRVRQSCGDSPRLNEP